MVPVPAGTFRQGEIVKGFRAESVHGVTIKSFAMGKYEVTFEEYDRFAIAEGRPLPSDQDWGRGRRPVINVSWQDAKDYVAWLSKKNGQALSIADGIGVGICGAQWSQAGDVGRDIRGS